MDLAELGDLADAYKEARDSRLAADKAAQKLKEVETSLKNTIIAECKANDLSAVGGQVALVKYTVKEKPVPQDWPAIHRFMIENDAMDLMQKRLHEGACKERIDIGVMIPGVGILEIDHLSIGAAPK